MVENIRIYADILNRYEAPHRPPEETDGAKNGAKKPVLKLARAKR
jgi:hypothetical protein